jgi:hypothetical protein
LDTLTAPPLSKDGLTFRRAEANIFPGRTQEVTVQTSRRLICGFVVAIVGSGWPSLHAAGQRRVPGGDPELQAPVEVSLSVGGERYAASAPGKCTHAPVASIYQVVSELWTVQQSHDGRSLNLSMWRPKNGSGDMVSLSVSTGKTSKTVSTVRGAAVAGSGKVTLAAAGKGGVFTVDAKAADGTAITGTIKCDAFAPHIAEGG